MELTDEELSVLHGMLEEWLQSSSYWEDGWLQEAKSSLFAKVSDETKRRKFWWAR